jgi:hypothetical protein
MEYIKKNFTVACSVKGCNHSPEKFAIRRTVTGSNRYWAFGSLCDEHYFKNNKRKNLSEMEMALKDKPFFILGTEEDLFQFAKNCKLCGRCNLFQRLDTTAGYTLYLWEECTCDKTSSRVKMKTSTPTQDKNMTKPLNSVENFSNMFKRTGTDAAKRVAATQAVKLLRKAIVKGLRSQGSDVAEQASMFLETPYGEAMLAGIAGVAMQQFKIPGVTMEVGATVGEELFTQAMANVGNQFIADFSGPMLEAMTAMAAPLEQVRVSLENEKSTDEAPAAAISAPEVTVGEEEEVAFDFAETKRNLRRNGNARAE